MMKRIILGVFIIFTFSKIQAQTPQQELIKEIKEELKAVLSLPTLDIYSIDVLYLKDSALYALKQEDSLLFLKSLRSTLSENLLTISREMKINNMKQKKVFESRLLTLFEKINSGDSDAELKKLLQTYKFYYEIIWKNREDLEKQKIRNNGELRPEYQGVLQAPY